LHLTCTQPFNWQELLNFFAGRATPGVEAVAADAYRRSLQVDGQQCIVEVRADPAGDGLRVSCSAASDDVAATVRESARTVFDLDAPIAEIQSVLADDATLRALMKSHPGVRVPGAWDGFELTIRAILGQQISVKAATTIAGRIADRYGERLDIADGSVTRLFPTAAKLARARFNNLGLVQSRIDTIRRVASATLQGDIRFDGSQSLPDLRQSLLAIKGIGEWTTEYVCMRAMKDADAFPGSDLGLVSAIAPPARVTPKTLSQRAQGWRPWRAYAAMLLWGSLGSSGG